MARNLYALTEEDRRELRDVRRRVFGAHGSRRPVPTRRRVSGGGSAATDDDRRSCHEAVAVNLSGERLEGGHVGWIADSLVGRDLGGLYDEYTSAKDLPLQIVESGVLVGTGTPAFANPSSFQANDLLIISSRFNITFSGLLAIGVPTDSSSAISDQWNWWDQVTYAGQIHSSTSGVYVVNYLVVRGVMRVGNPFFGSCGRAQTRTPSIGTATTSGSSDIATWTTGRVANPVAVTMGGVISATTANIGFKLNDGNLKEGIGTVGTGSNQVWNSGAVSVQRVPNSGTFTQTIDPSAISAFDGLPNANFSLGIFTVILNGLPEATPPPFPGVTCEPLVLREVPRAAGFATDTPADRAKALAVIDRPRLWRPAIAKAGIDHQSTGTVVWHGTTQGWVYRRNLTDRFAGMPPENKLRTEVYPSPVEGEAGKLGRYLRRPQPAARDPRLGYMIGRQDILYSATSGPVEILRWGRDTPELEAITATVVAGKTTDSSTSITGAWKSYTLSTGANVNIDPDQPWTIPIPDAAVLLALDAFSGGYQGRQLWIDLGQDGGVSPPLYGDEVAPVLQGTSTGGAFGWLLFDNRQLLVWTESAHWAPLADGAQVTDTIVFGGLSLAGADHADYAPWILADPVQHPASFAGLLPTPTFAEWPEARPDLPGLVPEGSNVVVPEGYDPYFGRRLGEDAAGTPYSETDDEFATDLRLGLQWAVLRINDQGAAGVGGCC